MNGARPDSASGAVARAGRDALPPWLDTLRARAPRLRDAVAPIAIAAALAWVPFSTCAMRWLVGVPCPLCGMTRASLALARGDLVAATRWHPGVVPLAALGLVTVIVAFTVDAATWRAFVRRASLLAAVGLLALWAARALGAFGGPVS